MASKREPSPSMRMRKIALVICEGETEERTRELKLSKYDKVHTFLMYDMDVPSINEKLLACKAEKLLSNPCFEIWLLLHAKDQKSPIATDTLIKELKQSATVWKNYAKSDFTNTQEAFLKSNTDTATTRAKDLKELQNPSTGVYKLIELLKSNQNIND